jgi:hypothetical protein
LSRSSFLRWPIGYALDFAKWVGCANDTCWMLSGNQDEICELAVELGIQTIIEPYVDPARWQAEADISQIASELNEAAEEGGPIRSQGRLPQPSFRAGIQDQRCSRA